MASVVQLFTGHQSWGIGTVHHWKNCHYKTQGNYIWDSYESTDKRKPIDLLLELGADPDIKDNYGYTPLRYAVKRDMELGGGFEDIYQFMLSKTELNSTDNSKPKIHMHS